MELSGRYFGFICILTQSVGLIVYACIEALESAGLARFPLSPVNLGIARLSFCLLPAALIAGILGLIFDKSRTYAFVGICSLVPVFVLMVMISGYW
jgi:hypothetical protein